MPKYAFPYSTLSGYLLYRLLQLRFATRDQIRRDIFGYYDNPRSQSSIVSQILRGLEKEKCLARDSGVFAVSNDGFKMLLMMTDDQSVKKERYADEFEAIDRNFIESPPDRFNFDDHRKIITDTLISFGHNLKTDSKTLLKLSRGMNIRPDHTIISDDNFAFIEVENKGELKDIKGKMFRYIRYYFTDDFRQQFPDKKYMRVYIVESNQNALKELVDFLINLTYQDCGFDQRVHKNHDKIGRNLFRFSGLEFVWKRATEWSD